MRSILITALLMTITAHAGAQAGDDRSGSTGKAAVESGKADPPNVSSLRRIVELAHTEALPDADRVVIYPLEIERLNRARDGAKADPTGQGFPIYPYKTFARPLASIELDAEQSAQVCAAWRRLGFDESKSAFCHFPVYGLRFYRNDELLFETSICWKCTNFYLPTIPDGSANKRPAYQWYGFAKDEHSRGLLALLNRLAPHPSLTNKKLPE